jgi:aspartate aminotransferase, mitochondrial
MISKMLKRAPRTNLRTFGASVWADVTGAPADPILGINEAFKASTAEKKVLLGVGAYRDNDGKPWVLDCVKKA